MVSRDAEDDGACLTAPSFPRIPLGLNVLGLSAASELMASLARCERAGKVVGDFVAPDHSGRMSADLGRLLGRAAEVGRVAAS
jgi:hypothetical protein